MESCENAIKLKGVSIAKSGRTYIFTIPPVYIRNEQLDPKKKYTLFIVEDKAEASV